jgi:protein-S-isoprenylcysteine O-methyltransferase Ste14
LRQRGHVAPSPANDRQRWLQHTNSCWTNKPYASGIFGANSPRTLRKLRKILSLLKNSTIPLIIGLIGVKSGSVRRLFRREETEVNPKSPANRKLVTSGPNKFTRNPMYLGHVILTLGIALWVGGF